MPIVQAMGLEAKVSSLHLVGKKRYVMEDLYSFKFPRTSQQIKSGELESLINGLALIEVNASTWVYILSNKIFKPFFIYLLRKW